MSENKNGLNAQGNKTCESCLHWSEMLARAGGCTDNPNGEIEAYCHSVSGPKAEKYTIARDTCSSFEVRRGIKL